MGLLSVFKLGHPIIRAVSADLSREEVRSKETQRLIEDMVDTMRSRDGVGLAAPQVGVSKRLLVLEYKKNPRYPGHEDIPLTVLMNARILGYGKEELESWEGCLSVDGLRGVVPRPTQVAVEALDREGKKVRIDAEGFLAVILQHEIDHLDGKVFLDRMRDLTRLAQLEEWYAHWGGRRPVDASAKEAIGASGIDHVGLAVDDVEEARAWYVSLFGMREAVRKAGYVSLRVNEQFVFLLAREKTPSATDVAHVAFRVTREEFDKALATLQAKGVPIDEGPRKRGSGRSVYFKDPSGNQVELHHP